MAAVEARRRPAGGGVTLAAVAMLEGAAAVATLPAEAGAIAVAEAGMVAVATDKSRFQVPGARGQELGTSQEA